MTDAQPALARLRTAMLPAVLYWGLGVPALLLLMAATLGRPLIMRLAGEGLAGLAIVGGFGAFIAAGLFMRARIPYRLYRGDGRSYLPVLQAAQRARPRIGTSAFIVVVLHLSVAAQALRGDPVDLPNALLSSVLSSAGLWLYWRVTRRTLRTLDDPAVKRMLVERANRVDGSGDDASG